MYSTTYLTLAVLGFLSQTNTINAIPTPTPQTSDTSEPIVYFSPFKQVGCLMTFNPKVHPAPASVNLTPSSGCVNTEYTFYSYVESATAAAANGSCTLNIWSGVNCTGSATRGAITEFGACMTGQDGQSSSGSSVQLLCTS